MKTKMIKETLNIGDKVWIYLNKSKLHTSQYDTWVKGQIVGFTKKKNKMFKFRYT